MTSIFLDELTIANSFEVFLDELTDAERFSIYVESQTDVANQSELKDYVAATLDKVYLTEGALETIQLDIFRDSIQATSGGVPVKGYYYNFAGSLQVAGNVPNLLLDLSNPISQFLRSF